MKNKKYMRVISGSGLIGGKGAVRKIKKIQKTRNKDRASLRPR